MHTEIYDLARLVGISNVQEYVDEEQFEQLVIKVACGVIKKLRTDLDDVSMRLKSIGTLETVNTQEDSSAEESKNTNIFPTRDHDFTYNGILPKSTFADSFHGELWCRCPHCESGYEAHELEFHWDKSTYNPGAYFCKFCGKAFMP